MQTYGAGPKSRTICRNPYYTKIMAITINVSKTEEGYSASCDLIPGWVVAYTGDFAGFEEYLRESIGFYLDCAREDGDPVPEELT